MKTRGAFYSRSRYIQKYSCKNRERKNLFKKQTNNKYKIEQNVNNHRIMKIIHTKILDKMSTKNNGPLKMH